jgi:hypothetical protein
METWITARTLPTGAAAKALAEFQALILVTLFGNKLVSYLGVALQQLHNNTMLSCLNLAAGMSHAINGTQA